MPNTIADRFRQFELSREIYLEDGSDLQLRKSKISRSGRIDRAERVRKLEERMAQFQKQRPLREAKLSLLSPFGNPTRTLEELAKHLGTSEHEAAKIFWDYLSTRERKSLSVLLMPWLGS